MAGVGDVDGDGYDDVLLGAPGVAWRVAGPVIGDGGLDLLSRARLTGQDGDSAGWAVGGGGDVKGDG